MTNPLLAKPKPASASGGGDGPMNPGDIRTINAKDPKTGEIIKTITLIRTTRPYVEDLCEAYNEARSQAVIDRGAKWYVSTTGELKLGDEQAWQSHHTRDLARQAEDDRQRWLAGQNAGPISYDDAA